MIVIAFLFYLTFFCLGIYFLYKSYLPYKANRAARHWDKVKGKIVEVKANHIWQSLDEPIGDSKEIQLAYEFEYCGIKYRKNSLSLNNDTIHCNKGKKQTDLFMNDLNVFLEKVRTQPEIHVWVKPNNPNETIIRNLWAKYMFKMLLGITLIIWGLGITRIVMIAQLDIGGIKLEEKIEVVEHMMKEEINAKQAIEDAKYEEATRKGIEANLKWRKEQGLPID